MYYIAGATRFDEQTRSSAYRVHMAMFADDLALIGDDKLRPGLPLDIHITTEDRAALSQLLSPSVIRLPRPSTKAEALTAGTERSQRENLFHRHNQP